MKQIVVFYHANCPDGFSGAWAAWKKLRSRATYVPLEHQAPPRNDLAGKDVYFIDILYPHDMLARVLRVARSVTVIDHHLTNREAVRRIPRRRFSLTHSGAVLAWQYFHPKKPVPRLLRYVEDIDLWRLRLAHTREIGVALELEPQNFKSWSRLAHAFDRTHAFRAYIARGTIMRNYQRALVARISGGAKRGKLGRTAVTIANSPVFESELGNALSAHNRTVGLVWSVQKKNIKVSLRSANKKDVAALAKRYGGGGHKYAAGFRIPVEKPFPWKYLG